MVHLYKIRSHYPIIQQAPKAEGPMVQLYSIQNMGFSCFGYLYWRGKLVSVGPKIRWALGHGLLGLLANPALITDIMLLY